MNEPIETTAVAVRESKSEWQRQDRRAFRDANGFSRSAHFATGGLREDVLQRDGHACVKCGMTDAEHKAKWNRPITIDHKDRDRSHNTMENLQTLCLSCHGRKDQLPRLRQPKLSAEKVFRMYVMRVCGYTYEEAAEESGVSIAIAHKWINRTERKLNEYGISTINA